MSTLYTDGGYLAGNPDWHQSEAPWKARKIHEGLDLHGLRPSTVAEVGCGAGGVLANLQQYLPEAQLSGFDISPQAIDIARGKANARLQYEQADFLSRTEKYDVLLAIDVFEHVPDYFAFLRALRSHARHFVFHVPLEMSLYSLYRHGSLLETRRRVGHLHFYWKELALESLADCGYRVLSSTYTSPPGEVQPDLHLAPVKSREWAVVNFVSKLAYRVAPDAAVRFFGGTSMLVVAEAV